MPITNRPIIIWLLINCTMVLAMAVIGAITRLTESGLSITEWAPITGVLPPLNETAWLAEFEKYRATPQYQLLNAGMSLGDFQHIYFWEWLHRLWGRLIGLVYALPFFWFLLRGKIPAALRFRLWLILALGGLQGFIGWFMVQSGLVGDMTSVSHLRLALHLSVAFVIFAFLWWTVLDLLRPTALHNTGITFCLRRHGWTGMFFLMLTIIWGAFVAGLDAGMAYNTFPLMNGAWLPPESWNLQPLWKNFFDNTAMVQFIHRTLAIFTALFLLIWCWRVWLVAQNPTQKKWLIGLAAMLLLQPALGIVTLLTIVDISLATMHQAGALILLALLLVNLHIIEVAKTEAACLLKKKS